MQHLSQSHPSDRQLQDYGLGEASDFEAESIDAHLAACSLCCDKLVGVNSDDSFVALLRATGSFVEQQQLPPGASRTIALAGFGDPDFADTDAGGDARTMPAILGNVRIELDRHSNYRIKRLLGWGGMGVVYLATQLDFQRDVALKVMRPEMMRENDAARRFKNEVRAAGQLIHQNIVRAYATDKVEDMHFLVMEYVAGANLADVVRNRGPLSVSDACNYVLQAAQGLNHAHERRMVHRDIKPHNLMLTPEGEIKILDFGLARVLRPSQLESMSPEGASQFSLSNFVVGTPGYMAPEQVFDPQSTDIRADIFSLGCTFYYLLTGQAPFDVAPNRRAGPPRRVSELRPEVGPELAEIVECMMAPQPEQRYQAPAEVIAELTSIVGREKLPAWRQKIRSYSKIAVTAVIAALLLLIASVGGTHWFRDKPQPSVSQPAASPQGNIAQRVVAPAVLSDEEVRTAPRIPGWGAGWSPDGKQIALGQKDGPLIEVRNATPGDLRNELSPGSDPAWSPRRNGPIAYCFSQPGKEPEIWLADPDLGKPERFASGMFPTWSSDGSTVYFFNYSARTLNSRRVSDAAAKTHSIMQSPSPWPSVSPDGRLVAFFNRNREELLIVGLTTQQTVLRCPLPGWPGVLGRWSPDCRYFGFGAFNGGEGLWMLDSHEKKFWLVANGPYTLPCWSADGAKVTVDDRSVNEVLIFSGEQILRPTAFGRALNARSLSPSVNRPVRHERSSSVLPKLLK